MNPPRTFGLLLFLGVQKIYKWPHITFRHPLTHLPLPLTTAISNTTITSVRTVVLDTGYSRHETSPVAILLIKPPRWGCASLHLRVCDSLYALEPSEADSTEINHIPCRTKHKLNLPRFAPQTTKNGTGLDPLSMTLKLYLQTNISRDSRRSSPAIRD